MTQGQPDDLSLQEQTISNHAHDAAQPGTPAGIEQKVSWLELFFDLIFVVAFDQLAKRLGDSQSLENIVVFLLMFTAIWWAWASNATFAARYGNECRTYRWGTLAEIVLMAMIATIERGDLRQTGVYFAVAFGINRLLHAGLHLWADRRTPDAVTLSRRTASVVGVAGLLWLGSALLPGGSSAQLGVWVGALLLDFLNPVLARRRNLQALPHEGHLPERVGLLQIIALGGVMTEVVNGSRQQQLGWTVLLPALFSILSVVALWRIYFDQARALPLLRARMQGQLRGTLAWLYAHLPFTLSVVMLGVGLGHGISSDTAKEAATQQQFVVWPLCGALVTLAFLRWNSRRVAGQRAADRSLLALIVGALGAASLAFFDLDTLQVQGFVAALMVGVAAVVANDPATRQLGQLEETLSAHLETAAEVTAKQEQGEQEQAERRQPT